MIDRAWYAGKRVAVAGMGVSGLAVAEAVKELGGKATVFDQQPGDVPRVLAAVDALHGAEIEAVPGWHGRLNRDDFDLLVLSPGFPRQHPALNDMAGKVVGEVEFAYTIAQAPMLAITGTNGKSTTTVMLYLALKGQGVDAALCGNIAGSGYPEQVLTHAAMKTPSDGVLVAEISSAQLETIVDFRPRVATLTNLTEDHRDRYPDFADYRNAKLRMFENMGQGDTIVFNLDEPSLKGLDKQVVEGGARLNGFSPRGTQVGSGVTRREAETVFFGEFVVPIAELPFSGQHNVANAMTAWEMAAAYLSMIDQEPDRSMLDGLLSFRPLDNRMEILGTVRGVEIVNNSMCTNPGAVVASIEANQPSVQHILMGGNTKNMDFSVLRETLQDSPHKVYLFGSSTNLLNDQLGGDNPSFPTLEEAFKAALENAAPGEKVVLAPGCSSTEPYANFKERGEAFRHIVAKEGLNDTESTL